MSKYKFTEGIIYKIDLPIEIDFDFFLSEYCEPLKQTEIQNMDYDYLKEKFGENSLSDLIEFLELEVKLFIGLVNLNFKIKDLDFLPLKCIDFLIRFKNYNTVTSLEAMSIDSKVKYINFLKKVSLLNTNKYIICLDYSTNLNNIDLYKVYKI